MRLIVHAGPGKTGSTAIQESLRRAGPILRARGILYLGLMLEHSPVKAFSWQSPKGFEDFQRLPAQRGRGELLELLRRTAIAAANDGIHTLIISNESILRRHEAFLEAIADFRDDGNEVLAVAYARRYTALARSAYVQWGLSHKTYSGGIKSFRDWMAGRKLALSPHVATWKARLGDSFRLRNFDACSDIVVDFLSATGLPSDAVSALRTYETPSVNEMALRAIFNEQFPGAVGPSRFNKLFQSGKLEFERNIGEWLRSLLPSSEDLEEVAASMREERATIDAMLREDGQPPLGDESLHPVDGRVDVEAVVATIFQIVSRQALKIEELEREIEKLAASRTGSGKGTLPAELDEAVMRAMAPSLGYFGALASDCLEVAIDGEVKSIRLSLADSKPTFLNLRGLELVRGGKPLAVPEGAAASQSSVSGNDPRNGPDTLLSKRGIHSGAEQAPWWEVVFPQPVAIDSLRLFNRSDGWGGRSRTLRVDVTGTDGRSRRLHDGQSPMRLAEALRAASSLAGQDALPPAWPTNAEDASRHRHAVIAATATRIRSGGIPSDASGWRGLVQLLNVWGTEEPSDEEWTLIAGFLLSQLQARQGTSIKSFSLLLDSKARLLRLQAEINSLAGRHGLGEYMLTRHGVKRQGVLRREPKRFLDHLEEVVAALGDLGLEPVLAYGTLLGAVREGDFIAHDDDVDLLYRLSAVNRAEAEAELSVVADGLRKRGYKVVSLLPDSLNMHVIHPANGAVVDIFPCWMEHGRLQMHMESMKIRAVEPGIVYPGSTVELRSRRLPAPGRPDAFLLERYGESWHVSDQFFEWPWPLKKEAGP